MINLLYLMKKDIKEILGNKKKILMTLVVLIIMIISTSLYVSKQQNISIKKVELGVVNLDTSPYSKLLIEYFKDSDSFSSFITVEEGEEAYIKNKFENGNLDVYLRIPENFADNLMVLNHLPIKVMINGKDTTKAILISNILNSYEKYIRAVEMNCVTLYDEMNSAGFQKDIVNEKNVEISYDLIFTALGKENFFEYKPIGGYEGISLISYYVVAFCSIAMTYLVFTMGLFIRKDMEEKRFDRLFVAGVTVGEFLLEKLLFSFFIISVPISLLYIVGNILLGNSISILSIAEVLIFILFGLTFVILLNCMLKKSSDYILVGNFFCLFAAIFGGGIVPIMYLPDSISKLSYCSPIYWMMEYFLNKEKTSYRSMESFLLLVISICFYFISVYLFKKKEVDRG